MPEVLRGELAAEYLFGEALLENTVGVPVGVNRGVLFGVVEKEFPACRTAVSQKKLAQSSLGRQIWKCTSEKTNTEVLCSNTNVIYTCTIIRCPKRMIICVAIRVII